MTQITKKILAIFQPIPSSPKIETGPRPTTQIKEAATEKEGVSVRFPYTVPFAPTAATRPEVSNASIHHYQPYLEYNWERIGDVHICTVSPNETFKSAFSTQIKEFDALLGQTPVDIETLKRTSAGLKQICETLSEIVFTFKEFAFGHQNNNCMVVFNDEFLEMIEASTSRLEIEKFHEYTLKPPVETPINEPIPEDVINNFFEFTKLPADEQKVILYQDPRLKTSGQPLNKARIKQLKINTLFDQFFKPYLELQDALRAALSDKKKTVEFSCHAISFGLKALCYFSSQGHLLKDDKHECLTEIRDDVIRTLCRFKPQTLDSLSDKWVAILRTIANGALTMPIYSRLLLNSTHMHMLLPALRSGPDALKSSPVSDVVTLTENLGLMTHFPRHPKQAIINGPLSKQNYFGTTVQLGGHTYQILKYMGGSTKLSSETHIFKAGHAVTHQYVVIKLHLGDGCTNEVGDGCTNEASIHAHLNPTHQFVQLLDYGKASLDPTRPKKIWEILVIGYGSSDLFNAMYHSGTPDINFPGIRAIRTESDLANYMVLVHDLIRIGKSCSESCVHHSDLKPENLVLVKTPNDASVRYRLKGIDCDLSLLQHPHETPKNPQALRRVTVVSDGFNLYENKWAGTQPFVLASPRPDSRTYPMHDAFSVGLNLMELVGYDLDDDVMLPSRELRKLGGSEANEKMNQRAVKFARQCVTTLRTSLPPGLKEPNSTLERRLAFKKRMTKFQDMVADLIEALVIKKTPLTEIKIPFTDEVAQIEEAMPMP